MNLSCIALFYSDRVAQQDILHLKIVEVISACDSSYRLCHSFDSKNGWKQICTFEDMVLQVWVFIKG